VIDIAWSEFVFIAVLALILLGPRELPIVLKFLGKWLGKARTLRNTLSQQFPDIMEEEKSPVLLDSREDSRVK
jgi:sec-independent protein translocase protein TatB